MKNCTLIQLTEVSKKEPGAGVSDSPCLVNTEAIVMVVESILPTDAIPIIGAEKTDGLLRVVMLVNGRSLHVRESMDNIVSKCAAAAAGSI